MRTVAGPRSAGRLLTRLSGPITSLAVGAGALAVVAVLDPNKPGQYPTCPFLALTGHWCPGCGTLRAMHALTHGDLAAAAGLNLLTLASLPLLGFFWLRWAISAGNGAVGPRALPAGWLWALTAVAVVFGVVRNLPFGAALAP